MEIWRIILCSKHDISGLEWQSCLEMVTIFGLEIMDLEDIVRILVEVHHSFLGKL